MRPAILAAALLAAASLGTARPAAAQSPDPAVPATQDPAVPAAPVTAPPPAAAPAAVRAVGADALLAEFDTLDARSRALATVAAKHQLDPPLRALVDRLAADHARLAADLATAAGTGAAEDTGAVAPPAAEPDDGADLDIAGVDIGGLDGAAFRTALLDRQAEAVATAMRSLTGYVETGDRPDLVAAAGAALATLQEHQAAIAALRP